MCSKCQPFHYVFWVVLQNAHLKFGEELQCIGPISLLSFVLMSDYLESLKIVFKFCLTGILYPAIWHLCSKLCKVVNRLFLHKTLFGLSCVIGFSVPFLTQNDPSHIWISCSQSKQNIKNRLFSFALYIILHFFCTFEHKTVEKMQFNFGSKYTLAVKNCRSTC